MNRQHSCSTRSYEIQALDALQKGTITPFACCPSSLHTPACLPLRAGSLTIPPQRTFNTEEVHQVVKESVDSCLGNAVFQVSLSPVEPPNPYTGNATSFPSFLATEPVRAAWQLAASFLTCPLARAAQ